jgi:hypothetical protein
VGLVPRALAHDPCLTGSPDGWQRAAVTWNRAAAPAFPTRNTDIVGRPEAAIAMAKGQVAPVDATLSQGVHSRNDK